MLNGWTVLYESGTSWEELLQDVEGCNVICWVWSICCTEKLMYCKKVENRHSEPSLPTHLIPNTKQYSRPQRTVHWISSPCTQITAVWNTSILYSSTNHEVKLTRVRTKTVADARTSGVGSALPPLRVWRRNTVCSSFDTTKINEFKTVNIL